MAWSFNDRDNVFPSNEDENKLTHIKRCYNAVALIPRLPVRDPEREHENTIFCNGQFKHYGPHAEVYRERLAVVLRSPGWWRQTTESDKLLTTLIKSEDTRHICTFCAAVSSVKETIIECIRKHIDHRPS